MRQTRFVAVVGWASTIIRSAPLVFLVAILGASLPGAAGAVTTERVSVDSAETQATGVSDVPLISGDGRFIAFQSSAANLVAGDTNGVADIFVRDRALGTTERVSVDSAEVEGNGVSGEARGVSISADGNLVAFTSLATNLVAGDTNGMNDVFVRDRALGTTERVSVSSLEVEATSIANGPAISADGLFVAFNSGASNLVPGDTNGDLDVFVRDRIAGTTERVSVDSLEMEATSAFFGSLLPAINADGSIVAFESWATNLVVGDTNGDVDVFVRDRTLGTTERVSVDSAELEVTGTSARAAVNADGSIVAFQSLSTGLVLGDTNALQDVFVRNRTLGTTERVSVDSAEVQAIGGSLGNPVVDGEGRFVAFGGTATNLVPGDTNANVDIFLRDRTLGTTERVNLAQTGAQAIGGGSSPVTISADGRVVAFTSSATNLIASDTNAVSDIFVRDLWAAERVSVDSAETQATGGTSEFPVSSADGRFVAFASDSHQPRGRGHQRVSGRVCARSPPRIDGTGQRRQRGGPGQR